MAAKRIPFKSDFQERMLAGAKTATTRTRKMAKPGDTFEAFGANFNITSVQALTLREVTTSWYAREGADSPDHFLEIWKSIHPRKKLDPDQIVFLHTFQIEQAH